MSTNGGIQSRLGINFHREIEAVKDARLKKGLSKDRPSTERITNLIVRHKLWKNISEDIITAPEEEVEKYGK